MDLGIAVSVIAVIVAAAIGIAGYRLQRGKQRAEERERASAYVTAYFDPSEDRAFTLENVGQAPATDVRVEMTPVDGNLPGFNEPLDRLPKLDPWSNPPIRLYFDVGDLDGGRCDRVLGG